MSPSGELARCSLSSALGKEGASSNLLAINREKRGILLEKTKTRH